MANSDVASATHRFLPVLDWIPGYRGPWYGYSGWDNYKARNGITCTPGDMVKLDDGQMHVCQ